MPEPAPAASPAPVTQAHPRPHVEVLHWPTQEHRRRLLASLGEPRILLLAPGSPPPAILDDLEHWIPEAADPGTILRCVTNLQLRIRHTPAPTELDLDLDLAAGAAGAAGARAAGAAAHHPVPEEPLLDDDGLVHFRGRWVAVSATQMPVVDLLIRNYRRLVTHDDLTRAHQHNGGSASPTSSRNLLRRVATRLAQIGLVLHVVRKRGVILSEDTPNTIPR